MTCGKLAKLTSATFACAALTPAVSAADPVKVSQLDATSLRALFRTPAFTYVCPLTVYSEDHSIAHEPRHAALPNESAERKHESIR